MGAALRLAVRGVGRVAPNPAVGCVIVADDAVVGRGWTQPGGRPHAETEALAQAGARARGATAYVTLEPCSHTGQTGPCANALADAGIARCVIACEDPDPRVSGRGIERLVGFGVSVAVGVGRDAALRLNAGFFLKVLEQRPLIALKSAASLDGRIAAASGDSRWITGDLARARGHLLRAEHDAIMVGSATALADDPALSCRLPGMTDRSPVRVVLDTAARTPAAGLALFGADGPPTWLVTADDAPEPALAAPHRVLRVARGAGGLDARAVAEALAEAGLTRVLIEGGGAVAASFLAANLVDTVHAFRAPLLIGGDGRAAVGPMGLARIADAPHWTRTRLETVATDVYEAFERGDLIGRLAP